MNGETSSPAHGPARALKALVIAGLILLTVGCDQLSKHIARTDLQGKGTIHVVDNVFVLTYVENTGAFLSLGSRWPAPVRTGLLIAFPVAALAAILIVMLRSKTLAWTLLIGLSLIAGGGTGNLIDRLFRGGRVSDFLNLGIGSFRTGIFNLADFAVLVGCVFLLFWPGGKKAPAEPGAP